MKRMLCDKSGLKAANQSKDRRIKRRKKIRLHAFVSIVTIFNFQFSGFN